MANSPLDNFKATLPGGGARANQFRVLMSFPGFATAGIGQADRKFDFLCKTASLPATTIGEVPVNFRGRVLKLAGDRTFADWTTTIFNDTDFAIRNAVERWCDTMDRTVQPSTGISNPMDYQMPATVHQLDRNGSVLKSYQFHGMWPGEIGDIALDYATNDEIETFDVTWKFNYFTSHNPITTPGAGGIPVI